MEHIIYMLYLNMQEGCIYFTEKILALFAKIKII